MKSVRVSQAPSGITVHEVVGTPVVVTSDKVGPGTLSRYCNSQITLLSTEKSRL